MFRIRSLSHLRVIAVGFVAVAVGVLTACGGGTTPTAKTSSVPSGSATTNPVLEKVIKGTFKPPDTSSRPGVKNKKIVIISDGQSVISNSVPANAAADAARALGWKVSIYDGQLNPANNPNLVQQAIASGADGIVLVSIDCADIRSQLQQAKAKGIKVTGVYSFDCNDPHAGKGGESLMGAYINYGVGDNSLGAFTESYGYAEGEAVVAATGGKAKVIAVNDPSVTVLYYIQQGFFAALKKCSGCKVVAQVNFNGLQLGPQLQQMIASAILQHPEANAVKSPYSAVTVMSLAPAVVQSGRAGQLYVMGGEGFEPELDLLRAHQGVNAAMYPAPDWQGWAAIDTLNSLFLGKKPAFSGLGWQYIDATHNLPASGPWVSPIDFKAAYKKAWGVS